MVTMRCKIWVALPAGESPFEINKYVPELALTAAISFSTLAYSVGRTGLAVVATQPSHDIPTNRLVATNALISSGILNDACWKKKCIGLPSEWLIAFTKFARAMTSAASLAIS